MKLAGYAVFRFGVAAVMAFLLIAAMGVDPMARPEGSTEAVLMLLAWVAGWGFSYWLWASLSGTSYGEPGS